MGSVVGCCGGVESWKSALIKGWGGSLGREFLKMFSLNLERLMWGLWVVSDEVGEAGGVALETSVIGVTGTKPVILGSFGG